VNMSLFVYAKQISNYFSLDNINEYFFFFNFYWIISLLTAV
jgi:hypothetical protein